MKRRVLTVAMACAMAAGAAHGAGFALIEQSASGVGASFAGSAAHAADASIQYFNPAGLVLLTRPQASLAVHAIDLGMEFRDSGSTLPPAGLGQLPSGAIRADAGDLLWVPDLHVAWPLGDRIVAGLSVSAPYGLKTEYDDPWVGRFQGLLTELKTINVNPSVGLRVNDHFAIGVGVSWQRADAELTHAVMLGAATEGRARLEVDDSGWGWNIGVLFTPLEGTNVGLGYRSRVGYDLTGELTVSAGGTVLPAAGGPTTARIDMPEQAYLSLSQAIGERFTLLADVSWTGWGAVQELRALDPATGAPRDVLHFAFRDRWRYALGGEYQLNPRWMLRAGVARDGSPVDDTHRSVRLPDKDRTWLSVGTRWQPKDQLAIDAGYAHLFVSDAPVDLTRPQLNGPATFTSTVRGRYDSAVDIFSLQVTWAFR